jgi:hypothetical protein
MLSHTDWERHKNIMKENIRISKEFGLEVWVDNWGIGGSPGDKSHFLAYHPEAHMIFSDGSMHPFQACVNHPEYRKFTKDWLDTVAEIGGKTIFWDEPALPAKAVPDGSGHYYACTCPRCKKLFEEKYGRPMPEFADADAERFGTDTIVDYLREMTEYSHAKGITNTVCVMLGTYGMSLEVVDKICSLPYMDNIGSDPYWIGAKSKNPDLSVYEFVYNGTKENLRVADQFKKDHNLWIQTYANPKGREEEIIEAAEAAYDAGARTLIAWSYYGGSSNDYAAENPAVAWAKTCEAFQRVRNMERDRILSENRKKYMK